ncbi:hypothetical protein [Pantoea sp. ME81]|uniref:hypothetical protein n=1 Tax=Pantoea sp. ME81 TaxID=2743935 RepID=UPI0015F3E32C|nr:hypothetical protein [Pantoea sp. ME81]
MGKLKKLIFRPGVFFRDALIKKYPITVSDGQRNVSLGSNKKEKISSEKFQTGIE